MAYYVKYYLSVSERVREVKFESVTVGNYSYPVQFIKRLIQGHFAFKQLSRENVTYDLGPAIAPTIQ